MQQKIRLRLGVKEKLKVFGLIILALFLNLFSSCTKINAEQEIQNSQSNNFFIHAKQDKDLDKIIANMQIQISKNDFT